MADEEPNYAVRVNGQITTGTTLFVALEKAAREGSLKTIGIENVDELTVALTKGEVEELGIEVGVTDSSGQFRNDLDPGHRNPD